jgi:hypothetical protein
VCSSDPFPGQKWAELYDCLDDIRRAGLLIIAVKTANPPLTNRRTVLSYIQKLLEIRDDRFFCVVPKELREETKNSVAEGLFDPAPDILHHPPDGFDRAGSFKTPDKYGNLEVMLLVRVGCGSRGWLGLGRACVQRHLLKSGVNSQEDFLQAMKFLRVVLFRKHCGSYLAAEFVRYGHGAFEGGPS